MTRDWHEWHRAYDRSDSPLAQRLRVVQQCIRDVLDEAAPGPIQVVSMCAGEGRDLLGVLADHPRASDVHGRLVELDPELAAVAREHAPARIDVLVADAGVSSTYEGAVPADLVLVCGVFGNITDADVERTIGLVPMLCAPGAAVIWTRHRRPPDATPRVRESFTAAGFSEAAYFPGETLFGVGVHRLGTVPPPFRPHVRLFDFVGYDSLLQPCAQCGFSYGIGRAEVTPWLRSDARAFVAALLARDDASLRARPEPGVWSPLEYACHVRDVLDVQRQRIDLAQREHEPEFAPMGRDERVVRDLYNEQDPQDVVEALMARAEELASTLDALDDAGWRRTGVYGYPERAVRTVEWIGIHTVHELMHHRIDIGTRA